MKEQKLTEKIKTEVDETAIASASNEPQEIRDDSPPMFKDDKGSKGDKKPKGDKDPKGDSKSGTQKNNVGANLADMSFLDLLYNKIDGVIGGENPNQFLCLTLPGQALTAKDFAYDYKNNAENQPTTFGIQECICRVHAVFKFTCSLLQLQSP